MKNNQPNSIEVFFLNTLLSVGIAGAALVLATDIFIQPSDPLALPMDGIFLATFIGANLIRKKYPTTSILLLTSILSLAVLYQSFKSPSSITVSLSVILIVGFITSAMLKRWVMWLMHATIFVSVNVLFFKQFVNPALRAYPENNDIISLAITYSILYFVLTYATAVLKYRYATNNESLSELYKELQTSNNEIVAQNEELLQIQDHLSELNLTLEKKVAERTAKIQLQNDALIKYSFTNAHHLRGPVARLLGLANIYELDMGRDPDFFVQKMKEEAQNIDSVIKQINIDLTNQGEV